MSQSPGVYQRFLLTILPVCIVVFTVSIIVFEWKNYTRSTEELDNKLHTLVSAYSLLYAEPVAERDIKTLQLYTISLISDNDISSIEIVDNKAAKLDEYEKSDGTDHFLTRNSIINFATERGVENVGRIEISMTNARIYAELENRVKYEIALIVALILTLVISTRIAFHLSIGRPLKNLLFAIRQFEKSGRHRQVPVRSDDELGVVAEAYNRMQEHNLAIREDLLKHKNNLQSLVDKRTLALKQELDDHEETTQQLFEEKQRAHITLESITDAVVTTDKNSIVNYINPAACRMVGLSQEEALGKNVVSVLRLHDINDNKELPDLSRQCIASGTHDFPSRDAMLLSLDLSRYTVKVMVSMLENARGSTTGTAIVVRDITESRLLTEKLSYQANHDPLTGIANRRIFEEKLDHLVDNTYGRSRQHALFFLDLDNFKIINDTCGHAAGDAALKAIAGRIKGQLRKRDCIARLGGDEFGVLVEDCSIRMARTIGDKIRVDIENFDFAWEGETFTLGASIGIVPVTGTSSNAGQLMRDADTCCYTAKKKGRNCIHLYHVKEPA